MLCHHTDPRVFCRFIFHPCANNWAFRGKQRHGLTLHVGAHQGTVCVIVFQEGNQRRCHRNHLFRRNIHQVDLASIHLDDIIPEPAGHLFVHEIPLRRQWLVRLGHHVIFFLICRHINIFIRYPRLFSAMVNNTIRRLNEAIFINPRKTRQRVNQTDIRSFRRLNGAHTAIMGVVHIAHFKACPFSGQTARAQGRKTPFVGQLRKRIVLVHKLA